PTHVGARPVLAPCGRCAPPMPPDPVGQLDRSRGRPPLLIWGPVRCSLASLAPLNPRAAPPERERVTGDDVSTAPCTQSPRVLSLPRRLRRPRHGVRTVHRTAHARFPIPTRRRVSGRSPSSVRAR